MSEGIRIKKSKVVHRYFAVTDRTACGAGGMDSVSYNGGIPTDDQVTCKRCLKSLEVHAQYEAARDAANAEHAQRRQHALDRAHAEALIEDAQRTAAQALSARPLSKRARRAVRRALRAKLRQSAPQTRAAARARRAKRSTAPQPARVLLVAAGLPDDTAKRYAPAFSRAAECTASRTMRIRTGKHRSKRVDVKLYSPDQFRAQLAHYRPANPQARAQFAALNV